MANRSMLFAARGLPGQSGEPTPVLALGEFGWDIPALYKLLVSVNPQLCRSVVFSAEGLLAIAGDRKGGLDLLKKLKAQLPNGARAAASIDAAIAYLDKPHIDHAYFLLEPAEILDLENAPLETSARTLLSDIKSLRIDALAELAVASDEPKHWATDSWSSILYFEPQGSERPPIDPNETFLATSVEHLLAHRAALSRCRALQSVQLTLDGGQDAIAGALTALSDVPAEFGLTLYGQIERLPDEFGQLKNLKRLGLGSLGLRSVPESIANLQNLKGLYLQSNQLDAAPECLRQMTNLEILSLSNNPLRSLPGWIGRLDGLQALYVDGCSLDAAPQELWTLSKLTALSMSGNPGLKTLPDGIESLTALQELKLFDCGLERLPEGICGLSQLKFLLIGNNRLMSLPDRLYDMRLETLSLGGNPLPRPSWLGIWPRRRFRAKKVYWT
jgi:hypothetical protein